jgi:hypothetical protein
VIPGSGEFRTFDAFDLPDWTGTKPVIWQGETALTQDAHVRGTLRAEPDLRQRLDLLAVDAAYPRPVCPEEVRVLVHQAWNLGELLLLEVDGRVTAAAPGTRLDADAVCEILSRFARAVGAPSGNVTVSIVL